MTTVHDAIELHAHLPGHVLLMDHTDENKPLLVDLDFYKSCKLVLLVDRKEGLAAVRKAEIPLWHEDHLAGMPAIRLG